MVDIINANGIDMAYRLDGPADGPAVMLSNSLATNHTMWDAQIPALTDRYRVLRYDQRGHGGTQPTEPPYSFDLLLDDAVALMDALSIDKVHFCGLSMGGMTGQLFGAKRPDRLHSLVLCDTASEMPMPELWQGRIDTANKDGMSALIDSTIERWFTEGYRNGNGGETDRVGTMIATTPVDGYVGCCYAISVMQHTPLLSGIKTPTLVIVGADDPATTVEHAEAIHREIDGSELVVLDDAAHLANIEQPDAFNAALRTHLDKF
ncbi:MAG: 3-oxoadipate enol-lactonase [Alphaproteobacteria bacterium]|nr:3-oxoadipate enol-lactonase [Alphaproteobacteria bacterium]